MPQCVLYCIVQFSTLYYESITSVACMSSMYYVLVECSETIKHTCFGHVLERRCDIKEAVQISPDCQCCPLANSTETNMSATFKQT